MSTAPATIAVNRFGLGARPGELGAIAEDPRGWVKSQIARQPILPPALAALPGTAARFAALPQQDLAADGGQKLFQQALRQGIAAYPGDTAAGMQAAIASDTPVFERLVAFWSNHFTVSASKPLLAGLIGPYQTEAIRPHVLGNFADLVLAATFHPAMLLYLDNAVSIGPNSPVGDRRKKGLNENLARELMELHTLGVDGGYNQADVRELAKILTGWTVMRPGKLDRLAEARVGDAVFIPAIHEPGNKTLLGKTYREAGPDEAKAAILDLAHHPATSTYIATKLARHFIADQPPPAAVAALADAFRRSEGDLAVVYSTLVGLDAAWAAPAKYRSPQDWVVAIFRAFAADRPEQAQRAVQAMDKLGQRMFFAPSPAGWPDTAAAWLAPDALMARIDYAQAVGKALAGATDPLRLAEATIGAGLSDPSRFQIKQAPSRAEALALLLVSPEFMRR